MATERYPLLFKTSDPLYMFKAHFNEVDIPKSGSGSPLALGAFAGLAMAGAGEVNTQTIQPPAMIIEQQVFNPLDVRRSNLEGVSYNQQCANQPEYEADVAGFQPQVDPSLSGLGAQQEAARQRQANSQKAWTEHCLTDTSDPDIEQTNPSVPPMQQPQTENTTKDIQALEKLRNAWGVFIDEMERTAELVIPACAGLSLATIGATAAYFYSKRPKKDWEIREPRNPRPTTSRQEPSAPDAFGRAVEERPERTPSRQTFSTDNDPQQDTGPKASELYDLALRYQQSANENEDPIITALATVLARLTSEKADDKLLELINDTLREE